MSEAVIAAAESAVVQGAVKALAPEAQVLLNDLRQGAVDVIARIDQAVPELVAKAEHESAIALRGAQQHLAALLAHVEGALGIPATGTAANPTAAPEAPTPS